MNEPEKEMSESDEKKSYVQILKSSALIGGSSFVNIGLGILRTKVIALLLGPPGVGLLGVYGSISDLTRSLAGMGINSSGVRQIAEAVGTGDNVRIARTAVTLRRVSLFLGALGALGLLALSKPISQFTFGDKSHDSWVALLSLGVFFGTVTSGHIALLIGMRRVADMARLTVLGAFFGTVFSIIIVYFYGEQGVVPALVCVAFMALGMSWWYSRKIKVVRVVMKFAEVAGEASALLKLGVVFMAGGLMNMGTAYLARVVVLRYLGTDAVGVYHAAWALGGIYVGFILQAMGADFFPRLTAVSHDNVECNRMVNEQAEVGLLLGGPGVMAMLTFAPFVIEFFYSAKFEQAVEVLRWICLGMMLRVASWPMGFILLAKGERGLFFWSELITWSLYFGLVFAGVKSIGLSGTGIAFFGMYFFYFIGIFIVVRRLSGFRWSAANRRQGFILGVSLIVIFGVWYVLPQIVATTVGAVITLMIGVWSLRRLCRLVPLGKLPKYIQKMAMILKLPPTKASSHRQA